MSKSKKTAAKEYFYTKVAEEQINCSVLRETNAFGAQPTKTTALMCINHMHGTKCDRMVWHVNVAVVELVGWPIGCQHNH